MNNTKNKKNYLDVCVLMSTYNGEKYLREQIDSILAQKDVCVKLFVRDDGSSDSTLDILQGYADKGLLEIVAFGGNFGPAKSFMELLYYVGDKYDYYAFADQDDIWKEEKLVVGVNAIRYLGVPALYASNRMMYINGKEIKLRYKKVPAQSLIAIICENRIAGCTMVFNKSLATQLVIPDHRPMDTMLKARMHDTWVLAVAKTVGKVIYDENSYINYRIHENNTVAKRSKLEYIYCIIRGIFTKTLFGKHGHGVSLLANDLKRFSHIKDKDQEQLLNIFADAVHNKRNLLTNKQIKSEWQTSRVFFVLKVFLGWL